MESIGIRRLINQHVSGNHLSSVHDTVSWMGAIQAQDLNSAKWAIGVRLNDSTESMVNKAIEDGEIIRTHLLRPTWHFVAAEDYLPFLALTGPYIRNSVRYRRIQLGLDEKLFVKTNNALIEMLKNGNHLTRDKIKSEMSLVIPDPDSSMMNHILIEAEMEGIICSGRIINKQATYALVSEMLGDKLFNKPVDKEQSMLSIAARFFRSHGPATLADFNWWSGMSAGECRKSLDMAKPNLSSETTGKIEYWFDEDIKNTSVPEVCLLPAFDEFIIAYKDRSGVISSVDHNVAISSNGVFRPVIVNEGRVIGLWNKLVKKGKPELTIKWFIKPGKSIDDKIRIASERYFSFIGS